MAAAARLIVGLLASAAPAGLVAQTTPIQPTPLPATAPGSDVVVTAQRPRGAVIGDIPPERSFTPFDIRAFGANNVEELIQAIGPQVSSNRGREDSGPVTLLNGRRVSDFSEIARIPSEAIERMEVFPEEVALKYGYRADQKVVNIVTFERYRSRIGQATYARPTEGGRDTAGINGDYFAVRGDTRYSVAGGYTRSGALRESERDIRQISGVPELGRFRTLLPETELVSLSGLVSSPILDGVSSTANARFQSTRSRSLLGLGGDGPLTRDLSLGALHIGTTQNGRLGRWMWNVTGNYDRLSTKTLTDVDGAGSGRDTARSLNALVDAALVLNGPVFDLPAGPVSTSVRGGVSFRDFDSRALRRGIAERGKLSRDGGTAQVNLDLPILGRRAGGGSPFGKLSVNANVEVERLSDAGTLRTIGYGLAWSPSAAISVVASATDEQGAPSVEQLGAPIVVMPNVRTFDVARREVVDVTQTFGGNPALRADDRHVVRLGLTARPWAKTDLTLSLDYVGTRIDDPIASFPILTPEIEAAFPDRFTRDASGRLIAIDSRPVNFARSSEQRLRWGINFTRPLGEVPPALQDVRIRFVSSEADIQRSLPPGARIIRGDPNSPMARRAENLSSRLFFSLYHNWTLRNELVVRDGQPRLDLLRGDAIDFRGGRRRHEVEFQGGVFKRGLGARLGATWQSGTTLDGTGGGDLRFSSLTTVNLNLFANVGEFLRGKAPPWLKGVRASLGVSNLFNDRLRVRDATGVTPLSYQPGYLDPLGRSITLSIRKIF